MSRCFLENNKFFSEYNCTYAHCGKFGKGRKVQVAPIYQLTWDIHCYHFGAFLQYQYTYIYIYIWVYIYVICACKYVCDIYNTL